MDFSLTSDQLLIRDTVRQFMEAEVRGVIREYEREEKFPEAELRRLGSHDAIHAAVRNEHLQRRPSVLQ